MPADIRFEDDSIVVDGPVRLRSHAPTAAAPATVNLSVDDKAVIVSGGPLYVQQGAQVTLLEALRVDADALRMVGEKLSGVPTLGPLPSGSTQGGPSWARMEGLVADERLDLLAYVKLLHKHIAALQARVDKLERKR